MGKKRVIKKGGEGTESAGAGKVPDQRGAHRRATRGFAYVQATYNNTIITITDDRGNALAWSSAGSLGFSGAKKATPFAAARVVETLGDKIRRAGLQEISVFVKGVGSGRDSAVRALANQGLQILAIKDTTPVPHNGPRHKKVRRV